MTNATAHASAPRPMSASTWANLLLLGAIWGGSFFFARIAVAELHPLALVFLRVAIAAAALHLYLAVRGPVFAPGWRLAVSFLILALLNNVVPFSLIFAGQTELGAGIASVLNATTPFWTILVASGMGEERPSWNKAAGIVLGVAGTAALVGPGLVSGLGGPAWPKFAMVGASLSYAFALIYARRRFRNVPTPLVATGQLTASTAIMLPVMIAVGPAHLLHVGMPVWSAVFGLALLSTAFAYILYFGLIASAGPTNASLVTLIVPVSAILLGAAFLGERIEFFELGGMALIALGLLTIDGRLLRGKRRQSSQAG